MKKHVAMPVKHFLSYKECKKKWVHSWIAITDQSFFQCRIRMLPEGWEKVVTSDGVTDSLLFLHNKASIFTKISLKLTFTPNIL